MYVKIQYSTVFGLQYCFIYCKLDYSKVLGTVCWITVLYCISNYSTLLATLLPVLYRRYTGKSLTVQDIRTYMLLHCSFRPKKTVSLLVDGLVVRRILLGGNAAILPCYRMQL